jgi:PKD repeat protein
MAEYPVTVKFNRALPLKANLFDSEGTVLGDTNVVASPVVQIFYDSGVGGSPVDVTSDALSAGQGSDGNQFVFSDNGNWQFNLKIKNYTAPGTYTVSMESGDSSEYIIDPTCVTEFVIQ